MISHTFTYTEIFYAQYYRYRLIMSIIIIAFGLFAIGVMVMDGAYLSIGLLLFVAYMVMSYGVMIALLALLAAIHYRGYKGVEYTYIMRDEFFMIKSNNKTLVKLDYTLLETKVYRKLTYVYDKGNIVAFFPEHVRQALLK